MGAAGLLFLLDFVTLGRRVPIVAWVFMAAVWVLAAAMSYASYRALHRKIEAHQSSR
jgi:hypothetical protein